MRGFRPSACQGPCGSRSPALQSAGLPRGPTRRFRRGPTSRPAWCPRPPRSAPSRYLEARWQERFERTLETVDGVVTARVQPGTCRGLNPLAVDSKPRVAAQAAVLLKVRPERSVARYARPTCRKLVAGSVAGLLPESVAVVVTPAAEAPSQRAPTLASVGPLRWIQAAASCFWSHSWAAWRSLPRWLSCCSSPPAASPPSTAGTGE